jgi:hypothetical protein
MGWTAVVRFPAGPSDSFFILHDIQTFPGAHPASYSMCTGVLSPEIKRQEREADHSLPSGTEVKDGGSTPPLLQASSLLGS